MSLGDPDCVSCTAARASMRRPTQYEVARNEWPGMAQDHGGVTSMQTADVPRQRRPDRVIARADFMKILVVAGHDTCLVAVESCPGQIDIRWMGPRTGFEGSICSVRTTTAQCIASCAQDLRVFLHQL